jgi:hypothetical protein
MSALLGRRKASTAATYYKVLKLLFRWPEEEGELPGPAPLTGRPTSPGPTQPPRGVVNPLGNRPVNPPVNPLAAHGPLGERCSRV